MMSFTSFTLQRSIPSQTPLQLMPWLPSATRLADMAGSVPIRRIRQACAHCRHRKTRCSGEKPRCKSCERAKRACIYERFSKSPQAIATNPATEDVARSVQLSASEAANAELLNRIQHIESQLASLGDRQATQESDGSSPIYSTRPNSFEEDNALCIHGDYIVLQRGAGRVHQARSSRLPQTVPRKRTSITPDEPDFSTLPPDPVIQSLVNCYFENVHSQPYSYFQEESFRDKLASGLFPRCLIFAVLASALRFSNHDYFNTCKQDAAEEYARAAWLSVLEDHMASEDCLNLIVAQTTNLLAVIDFTAGRTSSAWLKHGLAVRIVQDLRLMHEPSCTLSLVEQEERRRVLWSVYLFDKLVTCGRSRPSAVSDDECLVQLPIDEESFQQGSRKQTTTLREAVNWAEEGAISGGNFALTILASSALGRCARYMFHQPVGDETAPWDSRSEFASINTYLLLLTRNLRIESTSADDIIRMHERLGAPARVDRYEIGYLLFSHVVFHLCYCLLNHPLLLRLRLQKLKHKAPASFLSWSRETSLEHACSLLDLLGKADFVGIPLRASFYAYATTVAGTITAMAIHAERPVGLFPLADLQEKSRQSLLVLARISTTWRHASKMHTQLSLFDFGLISSIFNNESSSPSEISIESEETLWHIVDYGLMCSTSSEQTRPTKSVPETHTCGTADCSPRLAFDVGVDLTDGHGSFCNSFEDAVGLNFNLPNIGYDI